MEPTVLGWGALALAAAVVGLSKAAIPGAAMLSVAIFAAVLPARESTAALLVLLIVGDLFALVAYRRHADWRILLRLAPAVVAGLVVGAVFLTFADDQWVRRVIGGILLALVAVTLWRRRRRGDDGSAARGWPAAAGYGTLAGFTTMVANAGGPVTSLYFVAMRIPVLTFLGTAAWFFALVNLAKLPFAIGLGLVTPAGLWIDLWLAPVVLAGAFAGRAIATRIAPAVFEAIVLVLSALGALYLLF
jgi:uncharacterized protein